MKKTQYYSSEKIRERGAQYNMIIGERSNGKTYDILNLGLENFVKTGKQLAIVRRWHEDFKSKRGQTMFDALNKNGVVTKLTEGEWNEVYYYSSRWYLSKWDEELNKRVTMDEPLAFGFSLASMEHDKSTSYPNITTILFDEFLTRQMYLPDEFILFMNTVSTIVRRRDDVTIFMCGNTVNKYCPYFSEMGISHIKEMTQGDIDVYEYGESGLRVAVEYCAATQKKHKDSNIYFAFDNPKLQMITGGVWELEIYPHCPVKYNPKDIVFMYFIEFDGSLLQCEIISKDGLLFTFIHEKTTPVKNHTDILFTPENSANPYRRRKINKPPDEVGKKIAWFFANDKVFYQSNDVGEVVKNYINWCKKG